MLVDCQNQARSLYQWTFTVVVVVVNRERGNNTAIALANQRPPCLLIQHSLADLLLAPLFIFHPISLWTVLDRDNPIRYCER